MVFCDTAESVLQWGSEEVVIPYKSPIDNRYHRYFVDFIVTVKDKTGKIKTQLVEVKPKKQCKPPTKKSKITKSYIREVKDWGVNSAKWEAANEYAENRGWKFIILTEDHLKL